MFLNENVEKLKSSLSELNQNLGGVTPYKLDVVNPNDFKLATKNARYMDNSTFNRLTKI